MIGHRSGFAAVLPMLLVGFTVACNGPRYQKAEEMDTAPAAFAVRVENPRESTEVDFRAPLSGTVSSNGQVQLAFQLSGKVTEVLVEEGDHVRKGQVLARLDDRVYQAQRKQALGATQQAAAQLEMLENGNRPEEIAAAQATWTVQRRCWKGPERTVIGSSCCSVRVLSAGLTSTPLR